MNAKKRALKGQIFCQVRSGGNNRRFEILLTNGASVRARLGPVLGTEFSDQDRSCPRRLDMGLQSFLITVDKSPVLQLPARRSAHRANPSCVGPWVPPEIKDPVLLHHPTPMAYHAHVGRAKSDRIFPPCSHIQWYAFSTSLASRAPSNRVEDLNLLRSSRRTACSAARSCAVSTAW
jgi:hypothetical protein